MKRDLVQTISLGTGQITSLVYRNGGIPDRDPQLGPAEKHWSDSGTPLSEAYRKMGVLHNPNGPALRCWDENGEVSDEHFHVHGRLHRDGGPAILHFSTKAEPGQLHAYYVNGRRHRALKEGPAVIEWNEAGEVTREAYYVRGTRRAAPKPSRPSLAKGRVGRNPQP